MPEYLTVDQIAATLAISKMTVYRLINSGEIPGIRVGRSFRVERGAFDAYLLGAAIPREES